MKQMKRQLMVRLDDEMYSDWEAAAEAENRTMAGWLRNVACRAIKESIGDNGPDDALSRVAAMHEALRKESMRTEQAFRERDRLREIIATAKRLTSEGAVADVLDQA